MPGFLFSVAVPTWLAIAWRRVHRSRGAKGGSSAVRSIIVFRLDQLGDLVLTTPLFRELKRLYPEASVTAVVPRAYKAILTTNRNILEILPLQELKAKWLPGRARWLATVLWFYWHNLRQRQFDLAISPRWDVDERLATLLCVLTNASKTVGFSTQASAAKRKLNRGFDAAFDLVVPPGPVKHEVDRNLAIVELLGGKIESRRLDISLTGNDRKFANELLTHHDRRQVLVAIGIGGRAASRKWPLQRYAECVARLNQQRDVQPVIVCSREEDAQASELSVMLPVPPYILSGIPLRAVCAVLERCDLYLGNDTGSAHLAAAMDCSTVVVSKHPLGGDPNHANSPERFAPICARYRVVQPVAVQGECVASCHSAEAHCIRGVTVDRVAAAAAELLAQFERASRPKVTASLNRELAPTVLSEQAHTPGLVAVS
jgi:ADP-heptose:LPS heptosyltransferase